MDKDHVAILLEEIKSKWELAFERFDGLERKFDARIDGLEKKVDARFDVVESNLEEIKNTVGLLHTIANDHETRLRKVESTVGRLQSQISAQTS